MAKNDVVMPQMGESITNGTITKWHKKPGDKVELDEILLEISTDKVESEIPSPFEGRIEAILFEEGETIDVGVKIAEVEDDPDNVPFSGGSSSSAESSASAKSSEDAPASASVTTSTTTTTSSTSASSAQSSSTGERRFYTPLVKSLAKEHGVSLDELSQIEGSGAGGRVNKEDFMNYINNGGASKQTTSSSVSTSSSSTPSQPAGVASVTSSGERVEIIPMDNMRKAIAKNMVESKMTSPHVNSVDEVDMTHIVKFREGFKNKFKADEGFSLTYTHFILYAMVQALKEWPLVNASVDGTNIVVKKDINLGCAVAVPGNGLVVPVIKSADSLNITGLARKVNELANKARAKKLTLDELSGGTFTFTNVGSFGTLMATPVILQPQVGIMAAGVIKKRAMVTDDDAIAIRSMMYLTHTYDHRLVDGELGGRFLASVKKNLETLDPASLF